MEKQKMTIHRALSELKIIDAKIDKQTNEIIQVGVFQTGKLINGIIPKEDFETSARSKYDSVTALIKRKSAIKSAIVNANSITKINVAGNEMTIADAITLKTTVDFKKKLSNRIKAIYQSATANVNRNNEAVVKNCQIILENTFGKENVKISSTDVDSVQKPFMAANEFHLFDPLDSVKLIEKLDSEISDFEAEVDAVLSEINAITFIEV